MRLQRLVFKRALHVGTLRSLSSAGTTIAKLELRRKRLVRRSGQRGMLEMDILLTELVNQTLDQDGADEGQQAEARVTELELLLGEQDADLWVWVTQRKEAPDHVRQLGCWTRLMENVAQRKDFTRKD